jgi:hypothetical protein
MLYEYMGECKECSVQVSPDIYILDREEILVGTHIPDEKKDLHLLGEKHCCHHIWEGMESPICIFWKKEKSCLLILDIKRDFIPAFLEEKESLVYIAEGKEKCDLSTYSGREGKSVCIFWKERKILSTCSGIKKSA